MQVFMNFTQLSGPTTLYLKRISPNPSVVLNLNCLNVTQASSTELCLSMPAFPSTHCSWMYHGGWGVFTQRRLTYAN